MDIAKRSVSEARHWALSLDRWLAVVALKLAEGATATRLAFGALPARESIAKIVMALRAAEENILVSG